MVTANPASAMGGTNPATGGLTPMAYAQAQGGMARGPGANVSYSPVAGWEETSGRNSYQQLPTGISSMTNIRTGATRTPGQEGLLEFATGDIQNRLGTTDPSRPFSYYMDQVGGSPFERIEMPQIGQFWNEEQQRMKSDIFGRTAERGIGGADYRNQQLAAARGLSPEAAASLTGQNTRSHYAEAMNAYNQFMMGRIPAMEMAQIESARLAVEQEEMARAQEAYRQQLASQLGQTELQRETALMNNYGTLLEPLPFTEQMATTYKPDVFVTMPGDPGLTKFWSPGG